MKDLAHRRSIAFCSGVSLLLLVACHADVGGSCPDAGVAGIDPPALDLASPRVSRENLRAWVEALASPRLAGRHAGTSGARATAALLAGRMSALGLAPPPTEEGFCQGFPLLDGKDFNVIGHLPSLEIDQRSILVGAHYDGQGVHPRGRFYPGADDNASGIAALFEVARLAVQRRLDGDHGSASRVGWVFAALGGEEVGRLGARAYLAAPSIALSRVELMVNLDMVGRPLPLHDHEAIGYLAADDSRAATSAPLRQAAAAAGVEIRSLEDFGEAMPAITDAQVFATRVPTVLLSTALHEDHHRLSDTPDRIEYAQIERAANLILALADILADR